MKRAIATGCVLFFVSLLVRTAAAAEEPVFQPLFDGKTLDGWKAPNMTFWSVEDGAITAKITKEHPCSVNQYLVWREPMDDFELKMQFRITGSPGTNSGFQFRSRLLPNHDMAGYQMDNNRDTPWLARLYEEHGRDTLAFRGKKAVIGADGRTTLSDIPEAGGAPWFKLEEWHEYHLICQGPRLTLKVNGRLAAEVIDGDAKKQAMSGLLGLQLHSGPPMVVQFRDIQLKRLPHAADATPVANLPTYHFTSPNGADCMPFDPNGAIFWKGRYHLGWIYQNKGVHYWGHASSTDLNNWKIHPPMLFPKPGDPDQGIFSGNAFIDKKGRVAVHYHGCGAGNCIAFNADDELNVFKKLPENPVMKNPGWDPYGWLEGDTYYSISGGNPPSLYKSLNDDQTKWKLLGLLLSKNMPDVEADEDISCPDLFQLGDKRILLCISHKRGARYYVGRFEQEKFHPEQHFRMNWPGGTCFAPETLLDGKGRRILWAWAVGNPSSMTVPRILSMGKDGVLQIEPAPELDALRTNPQRIENLAIKPEADQQLEKVRGDVMELRVKIDPQQAPQCGLKVRCSPGGEEQTVVAYDAAKKVVRIDLTKSSLNRGVVYKKFVMPAVPNPDVTAQEAPFELKPGETLDLRIYLDRSMLEVFANGRQCLTQRIYPTRKDSLGVSLFSAGGEAKCLALDAWEMIPTKFTTEQRP